MSEGIDFRDSKGRIVIITGTLLVHIHSTFNANIRK